MKVFDGLLKVPFWMTASGPRDMAILALILRTNEPLDVRWFEVGE